MTNLKVAFLHLLTVSTSDKIFLKERLFQGQGNWFLSKNPLLISRQNSSQFIGLTLLFCLVFVSKPKTVNSQYFWWNRDGKQQPVLSTKKDIRVHDVRYWYKHAIGGALLAWLCVHHEGRALIRRNAVRKTTNTNQHVESSGTSSKANFKSGWG